MTKNGLTTIQITTEVKEELQNLGKLGENYSVVIKRLLDFNKRYDGVVKEAR